MAENKKKTIAAKSGREHGKISAKMEETKTKRLNCLNKGGKWIKGKCAVQDEYITPDKILKAHLEK